LPNNGGRIRRNKNGGNELTPFLQDFKGEVPEVGAVFSRGSEHKDLKDMYQNLIEKLVSYVTRSTAYPNARDIVPLLTDLADVRAALVAQLPPYPPSAKAEDGTTDVPPS